MSINKVILIGNLGQDPDIRKNAQGQSLATLSIATSERWRDKDSGERKERTEWHRVVIFNEALAKVAEQYLHKGSKVYVEGQLRTRKWTDQGGVERYTTEVVLSSFNSNLTMLDKRQGPGTPDSEDDYGRLSTRDGAAPGDAGKPPIDDEIPF